MNSSMDDDESTMPGDDGALDLALSQPGAPQVVARAIVAALEEEVPAVLPKT